MSDPPLSDIDFINQMAWVLTTLKRSGYKVILRPKREKQSFAENRQKTNATVKILDIDATKVIEIISFYIY